MDDRLGGRAGHAGLRIVRGDGAGDMRTVAVVIMGRRIRMQHIVAGTGCTGEILMRIVQTRIDDRDVNLALRNMLPHFMGSDAFCSP